MKSSGPDAPLHILLNAAAGRGADPRDLAEQLRALGVSPLVEPVEQLGGTFEIGPNPNGPGTMVRVTVPCDD